MTTNQKKLRANAQRPDRFEPAVMREAMRVLAAVVVEQNPNQGNGLLPVEDGR